MINCADFLNEIGNYLEGDIAPAVRQQLEQHLAHCRQCSVVVDSTRKTLRIVTESDSFELPGVELKPLTREIMERIRSR